MTDESSRTSTSSKLELARPGPPQPGPLVVDLAARTLDIVSTFRPAAAARGLMLDVRCDSALVATDPTAWDEIVSSLLGEALARTREGGIAVELRIDERLLALEVRDSSEGGSGRMNLRAPTGSAVELVRRIGGELDVRSELGRGTTSTMTVPIPRGWRGVRRERDAASSKGRAPARILVVDDNDDMRSYLARLLEPRFEVDEASDGQQALALALERPPALVLTDVMMPNVNGFELVRALRQHPRTRTVPVVVLSARGGEDALVAGLDAGADDYLVKPFSERELCARVETHLALNAAREEAARHERELREIAERSRRQLHDIFRDAPALILVTRGAGHVIELMNPAFARFVGRASEGELVGKPVDEALPELAERGFLAPFGRALEGGERVAFTEKPVQVARNGVPEEAYLDFLVQPLRDAEDRPTGVLVHALDVTERVRARRQKEADQARLELVMNAVPALVGYVGPDGRYQFANRYYRDWFGIDPSEVLGKTVAEILGPSAHEALEPYVKRALAGESVSFELVVPYRRGERRVWATYTPDRDARGELRGFVALVSDVTERRELEEKMQASQRMESIGRLAGGVAHEVNNALTSVIGFADLLEASFDTSDPRREDVQLIHVSARRAAQITQQLLAFGRRQILVPRLLDLGELVEEFAPILRQAVGKNSLVDIARPEGNAIVMADRLQLEQVLLNLALNARDAMGAFGGRLSITVQNVGQMLEDATDEPSRSGPAVELAVRDDGAGMDDATKQKIFEPFFTTKPVGQGTGLGLAMVYGIVKQSGGHITVESELGTGTCFRIRLPSRELASAPASGQGEPSSPASSAADRRVVLVLDDEPAVLSFLGRALRGLEYVVYECSTAEEALTRVALLEGKIDLLVADLVLPGTSGRKVADRLHETKPEVPVLYISGFSDDEMIRRGLLGATDAFLQKPFAADELLAKVRECLGAATLSARS